MGRQRRDHLLSSHGSDFTDQALINGGLQIFNIIAAAGVGAMLVDRLGRKPLLLWGAADMGISYIVGGTPSKIHKRLGINDHTYLGLDHPQRPIHRDPVICHRHRGHPNALPVQLPLRNCNNAPSLLLSGGNIPLRSPQLGSSLGQRRLLLDHVDYLC